MRTLRRIAVPIALVAGLTLWLSGACPKGAHAQGCVCVTDPPVEFSLSKGGGAGSFKSNGAYLSGLNNTLFSGITSSNFLQDFPGWMPLPPNSSDLAKQITTTTMTTYASAFADAQSQMTELAAESFTGLEQLNGAGVAVLYELQVNAEIELQILNQLQLQRQLLADLVVVEATAHAEALNERAQAMATHQAAMAGQP
jgi:hypothetical protein